MCDPGVVEYLSNGGVADTHKDFKELRYNECLTNFSCNGKNGTSDGSITHSFQLKSAYDSNLMPYTNYTYDFKVRSTFLQAVVVSASRNHVNALLAPAVWRPRAPLARLQEWNQDSVGLGSKSV